MTDFHKTDQIRWLTITGGLYFVALLIFSMCLLRERFMVDGAYMIFEIVNEKTFPGAQNRYILWILDFFPVMSAKLALPMKVVMASWVLNYVVFYSICFFVVLRIFKDVRSAWLILFMNLFAMNSCFFNIADEIVPSATLAVVCFSYWHHSYGRNYLIKYALIVAMLFFTVFGHVLVPFSLMLAAAYYFISEKERRNALIHQFSIPAILFVLFLIMRIYYGMNDSYEHSNMTLSGNSVFSVLSFLEPTFLVDFVWFFIRAFPVVALVGILVIIYFIKERKWLNLALLFGLAAIYMMVWYMTILGRFGNIQYTVRDNVIVRWMFPLNFLVLYIFFMALSDEFMARRRMVLNIFFYITITFQFIYLFSLSNYPSNTLSQLDALTAQTNVENGWKYFCDDNMKCPHGQYHSVYTNSMVFTAMKGRDQTRQFVFAREDEIQDLTTLGMDSIYLAKYIERPLDWLNPRYFNLSPGNYQKVDVNYVDCRYD